MGGAWFSGKWLAVAKGLALACVAACLALAPGGLAVADVNAAPGRLAVAPGAAPVGGAPLAPAIAVQSGADLSPGVYTVPIALMKENDHATSSAAAGAFANEARLSVASGGVATLTVDVQPVVFGSLTGYATNYLVYQGDSTKSETQTVTVVAWANSDDGTPQLDANGNPVPATISFTIPDLSFDGVYLNMFVDAMGAAPNAWMHIDYDRAALDGQPIVYSGTSHVDQFGGYDVNVDVTVQGGIIQAVAISGANYASSDIAHSEGEKMAVAIEALKDKWSGMWIGHGHSNAEALYKAGGEQVGTASVATYLREAIRDAVMDALGISWTDEVINVPSAPLAAGTYSVNASYYTDVVLHQLLGAESVSATLRVAKDGSMQVELDLKNGTPREPLYTMAVNGYYEGNDASAELSKSGMTATMGAVEYSDAYFPAGTKVVTHLSVPLVGGLAREYATQVHLYAPAMNALVGEENGIVFDHGRFDVNAYVKVYWDSAKLLKADGDGSGEGADVDEGAGVTGASAGIAAETAAAKAAAAKAAAKRAAAELSAAKTQKLSGTKSYKKAFGAKAFKLNAKSSFAGAALSFKSSNRKVAVVSRSGKVTLKAPGTATISVTSKAVACGKTFTKTMKIRVKVTLGKAKLTAKTKSAKAGKVTVAWKKVKGAKGYQLKVGKKTYTVKSGKAMKKTVPAAKGKSVKVRVRAWSNASGKRAYGLWSKTRTVKVRA